MGGCFNWCVYRLNAPRLMVNGTQSINVFKLKVSQID